MRLRPSGIWTSCRDWRTPDLREYPALLVADGLPASDMTRRPRHWPSMTPCCAGNG